MNFRPKSTNPVASSQPKPVHPSAAKRSRWWRAMDHLVTSDSQKKSLSDGPLTRALSSILQQQNPPQHFHVNTIVSPVHNDHSGGITNAAATVLDISDDDSSVSIIWKYISGQSFYYYDFRISTIETPTLAASPGCPETEPRRLTNHHPTSNLSPTTTGDGSPVRQDEPFNPTHKRRTQRSHRQTEQPSTKVNLFDANRIPKSWALHYEWVPCGNHRCVPDANQDGRADIIGPQYTMLTRNEVTN